MRRVPDRGVDHAVEPDIDAVDGPAGGLVAHVEARHRLADPAEIFGILQGDVVPRLQRQRRGGQGAVAEAPAGGGVDHAPVLGGQAGLRHGELGGRRPQEHLAGGGAEAAHGLEAGACRERPAGHPQAVDDRVVGAGRGAFHREARRVEVELLADRLGEAGVDALAALHEGAEQAHGVVGADLQEGRHAGPGFRRDGRRAFGAGLGGGRREPEADPEEQRARGGPQEAAAGEVAHRFATVGAAEGREVGHRAPPQAAACRTAAAMAL